MVKVYKDKEVVWLYAIVGIPSAVVVLLAIIQGEWIAVGLTVLAVLSFAYLGWPIWALIDGDTLLLKTPLRRVLISPQKLLSVKVVGARDYRAHLSFRTKMNIPVGYRCRQYESAPELAQKVLNIIEKAPQAKVSPDALKLLRKVAKGSTKPLPIKSK